MDVGRESYGSAERHEWYGTPLEAFVSMWRILLGDFGERDHYGEFVYDGGDSQDWLLQIVFVGYTLIGLVQEDRNMNAAVRCCCWLLLSYSTC